MDHADHIMEDGREPNFGDLTRFVKNKARVARNMYGLDMSANNNDRPKKAKALMVQKKNVPEAKCAYFNK